MRSNIDWMKELGRDVIEGKKEIYRKKVRKQVMSGVIYIPKKNIGKKVVVIVFNEDKNETEQKTDTKKEA